jgi:hypothetical protein
VRLQVGDPQVPMVWLVGEKNNKQHVGTSCMTAAWAAIYDWMASSSNSTQCRTGKPLPLCR